MKYEEFKLQLARIEKQFGPYGLERSTILFEKVSDFSSYFFKTAVDSKIAYFRFTPLPSDFDEDIAQERDRQRIIEREKSAQDAKDGWGCLPGSDKATACQGIRDILSGKMKMEHRESFISSLSRAAEMSEENSV